MNILCDNTMNNMNFNMNPNVNERNEMNTERNDMNFERNNMNFERNNMNFEMSNIHLQHRNALLLEIKKYQLATLDVALFLDTHPNDPIALIRHHEYSTKLMQLKDEFATKHGPLDIYTPDISGTWRYIESPWPWE